MTTINYKGNLISLQSGDIVLFRNNFIWYKPITYLSAIVRYFTKGYYNHCGVVVSNWGHLEINEALGSGIVGRSASRFLERPSTEIKVIRPVTPVDEAAYCAKANFAKGSKYDFKNLIVHQLIFRIIGKWFGGTTEKENGKMVCSEYCAWTHDIYGWYQMSTKEVEDHAFFKTVFEEKAS